MGPPHSVNLSWIIHSQANNISIKSHYNQCASVYTWLPLYICMYFICHTQQETALTLCYVWHNGTRTDDNEKKQLYMQYISDCIKVIIDWLIHRCLYTKLNISGTNIRPPVVFILNELLSSHLHAPSRTKPIISSYTKVCSLLMLPW